MALPVFYVDAFVTGPFSGNPAAVCLDDTKEGLSEKLMQKIAAEINLSETAYIRQRDGDFATGNNFDLRWFTPTVEVSLCGHATMASATTLFFCKNNVSSEINFFTKSGKLVAIRDGDLVGLNLPENKAEPIVDTIANLNDLINATIGDLKYEEVMLNKSNYKLLIRLSDETTREQFDQFKPNFSKMVSLHKTGLIKGVVVTLKGKITEEFSNGYGKHYDFISRYFAPWNGILEDPFTGAAHTLLVPYWKEKTNQSTFLAYQSSARGGEAVVSSHGEKRVQLKGKTLVFMKGFIDNGLLN